MKRSSALLFFVFVLSFAASAADSVVLTGDVIQIDPTSGIKEFTIQRENGEEFDTVTFVQYNKSARGYLAVYRGHFGAPIEPSKGNNKVYFNGGVNELFIDSSDFSSKTPYFLVLTFGDNYFSIKDGELIITKGIPIGL